MLVTLWDRCEPAPRADAVPALAFFESGCGDKYGDAEDAFFVCCP